MLTIDEHTFDEKLLTGKLVIDAGCRGFKFSEALADLGCPVLAMDIEDFGRKNDGRIWFTHGALWRSTEPIEVHRFGDGSANFAKGLNGIPYNGPDRPCVTEEIQGFSLEHMLERTTSTEIDLLKLDIEGSEYGVLMTIGPGLLPRQITCEFHPHCHPELHNREYSTVLEHLLHWYGVSYHSNYPAYPALDTLFIRQDLL